MAGYRKLPVAERHRKRRRRWLIALFVLTFFYVALFTLFPRVLSLQLLTPVIIVYLLIIWALPVAEFRPPKYFSVLFWGYFLSLLLWPNYLAVDIPGLPWITMVRLFGGPIVLLLLIYASCSGPFRREMTARIAEARWLIWLVTAFAVIQVLSVSASDNPFFTLNRMVNNQIAWTAVFFASIWTLRTSVKIDTWIRLYMGMCAILCVVAVLEARKQGILWAESIPSFLAVDDPVVEKILSGSYRLGQQYRVKGTATTPLSFAELLGAATPFVLYGIVQYKNTLVRLALVALDLFILYAVLQTYARLGMVSFILGHAAYAAYFSYRIVRNSKNALLNTTIGMIYAGGIVLTVLSIFFVGRVRNVVLGTGATQFSNQARIDQFAGALEALFPSVLFGYGTGQGGPRLGFRNPEGQLTIDSYYLSVLLDYGILGFAIFYGAIIYAIVRCVKMAKVDIRRENHQAAALGIFLFCFLVTKAVLSQEANHSLIFMALGAVVSLCYLNRSVARTDHPISPLTQNSLR